MSDTQYTFEEIRPLLARINLGPAGKAEKVEEFEDKSGWVVYPTHRQRLDHYVGVNYHPGKDDDPEGWDSDGWEEDYSDPTRKTATKWLESKFGPKCFDVVIGEKGHVCIYILKFPTKPA
jgi:hypothetical protein